MEMAVGLNRNRDKKDITRTFEELEALEAKLNGPEDFANLIDKFRESIADGTWEFMGTDNFVAAQALAADGFRENCEAQNVPCPEPPTWRAVSLALSRAMWMA